MSDSMLPPFPPVDVRSRIFVSPPTRVARYSPRASPSPICSSPTISTPPPTPMSPISPQKVEAYRTLGKFGYGISENQSHMASLYTEQNMKPQVIMVALPDSFKPSVKIMNASDISPRRSPSPAVTTPVSSAEMLTPRKLKKKLVWADESGTKLDNCILFMRDDEPWRCARGRGAHPLAGKLTALGVYFLGIHKTLFHTFFVNVP